MLHYANAADVTLLEKEQVEHTNRSNAHLSFLYMKPGSSNLVYAYWVAGIQPYYQSWHAQMLQPQNSPGYDVGISYALGQTDYSTKTDWMHINTRDNAGKQATQNTDLSTLEFVGPPFEMSPPVFGIKKVDSTVNFNFDSVDLNISKLFEITPGLQANFFGGLNILHVGQTISTTFSQQAGVPATSYSYALDADPAYSFQLKSQSKYVGAGPDLGLNLEYAVINGFGLIGEASGSLTTGTTTTQEQFTSTSQRLTAIGIGISHQAITTPNKTQIVPGFDGKLGVFYRYTGTKIARLTIEGGYRMLNYLNAITTIRPSTLVQPGTTVATPEFSTGTMAIVSVQKEDSPFNLNGPYVDLKIAMD